jgi:hypothetical protein
MVPEEERPSDSRLVPRHWEQDQKAILKSAEFEMLEKYEAALSARPGRARRPAGRDSVKGG